MHNSLQLFGFAFVELKLRDQAIQVGLLLPTGVFVARSWLHNLGGDPFNAYLAVNSGQR
ncbi:MAG: hypothetical protein GY820_40785 [Gammaproteobacteria bacterium]|nr:hypothetical protein [Gammaproteobacteria bacterium]